MAPFNTHFLIAEKIWPTVKTMTVWPELCNEIYYGQFCFGCVAPDVDKISAVITQKDTHFYDRKGPRELMASHRTATFLDRQAEFLAKPFNRLDPEAQAFALGYLCHLSVDEVSKHMWGHRTWMQFKDIGPGPAFAALDEVAGQRIGNYPALVNALGSIQVLDVVPRIPLSDLQSMWQGVYNFAKADTVDGEYLTLVDMFLKPAPEQRQQNLQNFQAEIDRARQRVHVFKLDMLVRAGLARSRHRLADLIAGRIPEPGMPTL